MKALRWILGIALGAWICQYLLALAVPYAVMGLLHKRGGESYGHNRIQVMTRVDATSRTVVRPSPDLLYAMCIYDLDHGPLRIVAPVPDRYWSMQFYQMNTDNYAGLTNQRDEHWRIGTTAEVTLLPPGGDPSAYSGEIVESPTKRGVVLLRASAIGEGNDQEQALEESRCTSLAG